MNLLFDSLTYNTRGHFAHCSRFAKYPRVLYLKPSNKMYVLFRDYAILPYLVKKTRKI